MKLVSLSSLQRVPTYSLCEMRETSSSLMKFDCKAPKYAMISISGYGLIFGGGHDIAILSLV